MGNRLVVTEGMDLKEKLEIENILGENRIKYYELTRSDLHQFGGIGIRAADDAIYIKDKKQLKTARKLLWEYYRMKNPIIKNSCKKSTKYKVFFITLLITLIVLVSTIYII